MEWNLNMETSNSNSPKRPSKRLLFDRRYGWVFDEWKDAAEDALAGGRAMFCIVPLVSKFVDFISKSLKIPCLNSRSKIDLAASSAVKVLEKPDALSPAVVQANLKDQLHRINSSMKKLEFDLSKLKTNVRQELPCSPNLA
ncbi:uncharacterized protein LOC132606211 isoform X1 [Lycium barbarum]|uniref:uncharacterized protein LOC132606211 isoform X1 n=1 Tax=Lycium barbarum TaxID=112863 RepID=UPI00293EEC67|nr:uncharacterized protein LOC132606211 isoform X1 [Lycium barbarum]